MMELRMYTGTKTLMATPMTRGDYNKYQGWVIPIDEDPTEAGYLVEYLDGTRPNHPQHAGYISWSPADVFDRAYREGGASQDLQDFLTNLKQFGLFVAQFPWIAGLPERTQSVIYEEYLMRSGVLLVN